MMYEGAPNWPENDRFWKIVDDHKVSHDFLYGADGDPGRSSSGATEWVHKHSLASACGCWARSVSPSTPEAWMWYHREIGKERCPIVDTWWQTETRAAF